MEHGGESSNPRNKRIISAQNSEAGDANIPSDAANDEIHHRTYNRSSDQYLPLKNLTRIMRSALPPHAKIADDAKETIQECVSEFINFVTAEAKERCHNDSRTIITAEDLLSALGALGFRDYVEPLMHFLNKHRTQDGGPLVGRPVRFIQPDVSASQAQPSPPPREHNAAFATAPALWPPALQASNVAPNYVMPPEQGIYMDHVQMGGRNHDGRGGEASGSSKRSRGHDHGRGGGAFGSGRT